MLHYNIKEFFLLTTYFINLIYKHDGIKYKAPKIIKFYIIPKYIHIFHTSDEYNSMKYNKAAEKKTKYIYIFIHIQENTI